MKVYHSCSNAVFTALSRSLSARLAAHSCLSVSLYIYCHLQVKLSNRLSIPDLVILADDAILVLEFKNFNTVLQAHIDQVAARLSFCMRVVWQGGRYPSVCSSLPCQLCTSCISVVSPSSKRSVLQPNPMRTNRS